MKKQVKLMIALAVMLCAFILAGSAVYAADGDTALTVQKNGQTVKTFTMAELEQIAQQEGDQVYSYSAFNTYGNPRINSNISGATVEGILAAAGIDKTDLDDAATVLFMASDGYNKSLTAAQLFKEDRYYYPHIQGNVNWEAGTMNAQAEADKTKVPAIIHFSNSDAKENKLYFGQVRANEQNMPWYVGKMPNGGIIDVRDTKAVKCKAVTSVSPGGGNPAPLDAEITIDRALSDAEKDLNRYEKIYYTLDGTEPDYGSTVYNYGEDFQADDSTCRPVLKTVGTVTLKVKVKAYGKLDSNTLTYNFPVRDTGLTVKLVEKDGDQPKETILKKYSSLTELKAAGTSKNLVESNYSGYNTYPTHDEKKAIRGVEASCIIEDALSTEGLTMDDLPANAILEFIGNDTIGTKLTKAQLFDTARYYYPNAAHAGTSGKAVQAEVYENAEQVSPIIQIGTREGEENKYTFYFGQVSPADQNLAECIHNMLPGGTIKIHMDKTAEKIQNITKANYANGATVPQGTAISFKTPWDESSLANKRDKIYYVLDPEEGYEPGPGDAVYNYAAYEDRYKLKNPPVLNTLGKHTIKVRVTGYGKLDSDVTAFTFNVIPKTPTGLAAKVKNYNSVSLSWSKGSGVTGYKIYRKPYGGSYTCIKTITDAATVSYTNTGLKTGTKYYYKIKATGETADGKVVYSAYSAVKAAKPYLKKPVLKTTAGKKSVTLKWNRIAGASGYKIYRSVKKGSGYKCIKTMKKGTTVSYKNTKLKKGKKYYYKVRAYRIVAGKKVYSSYSAVKYAKAK